MATTTPDIFVKNHGSILIFVPASAAGADWIEENIGHAMSWSGGRVVEPRYAGDIIDGAINDGLEVLS